MTTAHGMRRIALLVALSLLGSSPASALLVDDFSSVPSQNIFDVVGSGSSSQLSGGGILGGERDTEVLLISGTSITMSAGAGSVFYAQADASGATGLLVWDGGDSSNLLDPIGLGGADFTDGGLSNAISMNLLYTNGSAPLTVSIYTDAVNFSTSTLVLPSNIPPAQIIDMMFTDFLVGGGTGADFGNVGAISILIDGISTPSFDVAIGVVETIYVVPVPEPSTAVLLGMGLLALGAARRRNATR